MIATLQRLPQSFCRQTNVFRRGNFLFFSSAGESADALPRRRQKLGEREAKKSCFRLKKNGTYISNFDESPSEGLALNNLTDFGFSVFFGGHMERFQKVSVKGAHVVVAAFKGDVRDGKIGIFQEIFGVIEAVLVEQRGKVDGVFVQIV